MLPSSALSSDQQQSMLIKEPSTSGSRSKADSNSEPSSSSLTSLSILPRPPHREVARAVQNLGNTCYMNAVLQALAHAPELCMAIDVHGHRMRCPIYKENAEKIAARSGSSSNASSRSSSPNISNISTEEVKSVYTYPGTTGSTGTRKSSRRLTRSPTNIDGSVGTDPNATKFCALCETEQHMDRVHRNNTIITNANSSGNISNIKPPVAPTDFVHGFIDQAAPESFRVGQQEDSHEFLRLLIEAMQKSCKVARPTTAIKVEEISTDDQGNPQDTPTESFPSSSEDEQSPMKDKHQDTPVDAIESKENIGDADYPFHLFSGNVESKVTCGYCNTTSSTLDPIEDLGLEVTSLAGTTPTSVGGGRRNTPSPVLTPALADVSHSLQRFACIEDLDAGYKCEKCGQIGRATKQMRLASVPPILTLHLKRFRYGTSNTSFPNGTGTAGAAGNTRANANLPTRRSQRSSEVSQLIATSGSSGGVARNDWFAGGKSGSAKIEGPTAFNDVLDLKPYLTEELQKKHAKMFSRLFAVIVHVGKNSHSGHYLAYVRNISKNEWWKMDDARVTLVSSNEVFNAEAYMLFYRVVNHPYSKKLADQVKALNEFHAAADAKEKAEKEKVAEADAEAASTVTGIKSEENNSNLINQSKKLTPAPVSTQRSSSSSSGPAASVKRNPRKRKAPEFTCGEEWARTKTNIVERNISRFREVESKVCKLMKFTPEFSALLTEHASKSNAKVGHGPSSGVSLIDDCGSSCTEDVKHALMKCFLAMSKNDKISSFIGPLKQHMRTRSSTSSRVKL